MNFYSKYLFQCKKKNKSPSAAAVEAGLTKTSVTRWKNGSVPTDANILVLAEYFKCSFEDLAPDKEKKPVPYDGDGLMDKTQLAANLFQNAEPWLQDQVLQLLRAAEARREAQDAQSTEQ